jgi:pilus assembly protein FimV
VNCNLVPASGAAGGTGGNGGSGGGGGHGGGGAAGSTYAVVQGGTSNVSVPASTQLAFGMPGAAGSPGGASGSAKARFP